MDSVSSTYETASESESTADSSPKADKEPSSPKEGKKSALRRYIDSFDAETTKQMTNIMSVEAARLLSRQSKALWGDLEELTGELREARACSLCSIAAASLCECDLHLCLVWWPCWCVYRAVTGGMSRWFAQMRMLTASFDTSSDRLIERESTSPMQA